MKRAALTALALAALPLAATAQTSDWHLLAPPLKADAVIDSNPLQGYLDWHAGNLVPQVRRATEHYYRVTWADLETSEGVYDFAAIDKLFQGLGPNDRIAFGVMPTDTCCSRTGRDVPDYLIKRLAKGFWIKADPGNWAHIEKVYVPDWNDPDYLARWKALWVAIGKRYDGDPRVAWVDVRGYGNWGEGHVAGSAVYHWSQFPYDDPSVNLHGAQPGTEASRLAIADAIADTMPHTQLLSMTDDKPILLHLLRLDRTIPIGMRRDSWGANWFETSFIPDDMAPEDKALIRDRWKTAPLIVENYGWTKVFEAGYDGIVRQVADWHISALGNGNFNVDAWSKLNTDQQAALIRAGNRAGYRYVPAQARYRTTAQCPLEIAITWRNDGVAPIYEAWKVDIAVGGKTIGQTDLPRLLPGETAERTVCSAAQAKGALGVEVMDGRGSGRTMLLPLSGPGPRYALGDIN